MASTGTNAGGQRGLTLTEVARWAEVSRSTVRRYLEIGKFPAAHKDSSGEWRVPFEDLQLVGWPESKRKRRPHATQPEPFTAGDIVRIMPSQAARARTLAGLYLEVDEYVPARSAHDGAAFYWVTIAGTGRMKTVEASKVELVTPKPRPAATLADTPVNLTVRGDTPEDLRERLDSALSGYIAAAVQEKLAATPAAPLNLDLEELQRKADAYDMLVALGIVTDE